jgi:hypothetical protein
MQRFPVQSVYKNIFDNKKYVETYYLRDIETEMGLDQQKLINMATLLGSDYTEGIRCRILFSAFRISRTWNTGVTFELCVVAVLIEKSS